MSRGSIWMLDRDLSRFPKFFADNPPNGRGIHAIVSLGEM